MNNNLQKVTFPCSSNKLETNFCCMHKVAMLKDSPIHMDLCLTGMYIAVLQTYLLGSTMIARTRKSIGLMSHLAAFRGPTMMALQWKSSSVVLSTLKVFLGVLHHLCFIRRSYDSESSDDCSFFFGI